MANLVERTIVLQLVVTDPLDDPDVGLYWDDADKLGDRWEQSVADAIERHASTNALRGNPAVRSVSVQ